MCILILIHRAWAKFPILIAANRDEDPNRPTSRPQLLEFGGRRVLCPQDKRHGGTWIGVNDAGVVAALTNFEEDQYTLLKPPPDRSRGFVPLHALAAASANEAVARVEEFVDQGPILPFQLAIADSERIIYFGKDRRGQEKFKFNSVEHPGVMFSMTDKHRPGQCDVPEIHKWAMGLADDDLDLDEAFQDLYVKLATGLGEELPSHKHFHLCRMWGERYTVSSTLLALSAEHPHELRFWYAPGNPLDTSFVDYSGLACRLLPAVKS